MLPNLVVALYVRPVARGSCRYFVKPTGAIRRARAFGGRNPSDSCLAGPYFRRQRQVVPSPGPGAEQEQAARARAAERLGVESNEAAVGCQTKGGVFLAWRPTGMSACCQDVVEADDESPMGTAMRTAGTLGDWKFLDLQKQVLAFSCWDPKRRHPTRPSLRRS